MKKNGFTLILSMLLSLHLLGQDFKTVGYFPTYRFELLNEMEFDRLTHLNIAFANPNAEGKLITDGVNIIPVVQKAQEAGLEVYIALAGGAARLSQWENWIKTENRSAFISGIMDYVLIHNLQGVDVDLEWGTVNQDYSGFVLELKDSLDQYNLGMTAALPAIYRYPEVSDAALAAFDWVNIMAYDLTGPWRPNDVGPHSPYSFAEDALDYWQRQGLEKERMTLGVPFYAYDFTDQSNVRAYTFRYMVSLDPANAQLDQIGKIYFNGLPTIARKTRLALEETSGIMIWEIGQDDLGEFSLLRAIDETISSALTTSVRSEMEALTIDIFPNPVSDILHVRLDQIQDLELTLFSAASQALQTRRFQGERNLS
ncbi:MAG: glycosyl hydrolase family 18 protein, partial [Bacteroidota bacterium]